MESGIRKIDEKIRKMVLKELPDFIYEEEDSRGRIKIKISPSKLLDFCKKSGFYTYKGKLIRLEAGLAEYVEPSEIFQYCLAYVQKYNCKSLESLFITSGENLIIGRKGIILGLSECPEKPIADTATIGYFFYRNGIVKIEKDKGIEIVQRDSLLGFIWKDSVKEREFHILDEEQIKKGQYYQFVEKTVNNDDHAWSNWTALGYAIHGYKNPALTKAIIINDENLEDNGKPEGGTGKGLYVKAIQQIVPVAQYNGKNSDFKSNRFAYQNVKPTTRVIFIDDVNKNFPFEDLFSQITEDMTVERKHKDPEILSYKESPKFVLTTNYTIRGRSSSYRRRRCDIFLNGHYGADHRPIDDFGCEFFYGWSVEEWNRFDNFMMLCLLSFLDLGIKEYRSVELESKMLKHETSAQFWDVMEDNFSDTGIKYHQWKIKEEVMAAHPGRWVSDNIDHMLADWIKMYADFKGYLIKKGNYNGTYYEFSKSG